MGISSECTSVYHMYGVPAESKIGNRVLWKWSSRRWCAIMGLLGTEPGSSVDTVFLTFEPLLQPLKLNFKLIRNTKCVEP